MILRCVFVLFFTVTAAFSQNNLIVFSSNAGLFNAKIEGLSLHDEYKQEIKFTSITKDTFDITIATKDRNLNLTRKLFLLAKAKPVKNKEFVYSLELNEETKKLKLVFVTVHDIKPLPDPLLPAKPAEDTTYKWRNNVFGTLFELKEGKPIFYFNLPKNGTCTEGMTQANLDHGLAFIKRTVMDIEKHQYTKEIVQNNCITCKQLSVILMSMNYELDKLKLVKDAYVNLVDKKELKTLEASFRFESSKKEFANMLANPNNMIPAKNKVNCTKAEKDSIVQELISNTKLFPTDHERFQFMKEKAAGYCFTSIQFKSILTIFLHDREKLDLTKLFYNNITDKESISILYEVFSYQESIVNLETFIKTN
ncbi:MAG: DUF4476 domain-containing protein [Sphingobacteriaceae bacterium]|nr:DUF4476 domain-containing protein [Sphingobacteriaceae bacterium]